MPKPFKNLPQLQSLWAGMNSIQRLPYIEAATTACHCLGFEDEYGGWQELDVEDILGVARGIFFRVQSGRLKPQSGE